MVIKPSAPNTRNNRSCLRSCVVGISSIYSEMRKRFSKATLYLILWFLWMLMGTLYYSYVNHLGILVGFYQAVNIGYSIGYGFPREAMSQNWWFSSVYVILGASFVGVALGFFADKVVEDSRDWFNNVMAREQYELDAAEDRPFLVRARAAVRYNWAPIRSICLWVVWVSIMIMYSMISVRWPFSQAQYFAVSTCSTGGHMPIPDDSPDWLFGVTGFFAAVGVPLMGVAMGSLGSLLMEKSDDLEETKKIIQADVSGEELLELQRFGLEDGDGEIDKAEFIILCMVRLGTDPRLIQCIGNEFEKLDEDGSNSLSILEITRGRVSSEDLVKLGQSEEYLSKRRSFSEQGRRPSANRDLLGNGKSSRRLSSTSMTSLSSIPEADDTADHDEENPAASASSGDESKNKRKPPDMVHSNAVGPLGNVTFKNEGTQDTFDDNMCSSSDEEGGLFF